MKCLAGLMKSFYYLQRGLASIHIMTSLQAILTAFKEAVAHAMTSFRSKTSPIEVEVI